MSHPPLAAPMLQHALDAVRDAFVLLDADFRVVFHNEANRAAMRAAGADAEGAVGRAVWEVLPMPPGTDAERACRRAMRDRVPTQWEEQRHHDRRVCGRAYPTADGGLLVVATDATAAWAAERAARRAIDRAAALQAVTAALSRAATPREVVRAVIAQGHEALGAVAGSASMVDGDTLHIVDAIGYGPGGLARYAALPLDAPYPAPTVARTGEPLWLASRDERVARFPAVADDEATRAFASWAFVPLVTGSGVVGVLSFAFGTPAALDGEGRAFAVSLAEQCAQALERARLLESERAARAAAERAAARVRFLAEASARLSEAALSVDETLRAAAELAVPEIADWSFVEMCQPDGSITPLVIHHRDPAMVALGWEILRRYPLDPRAAAGTPAVVRSGVPELLPDLPPELLPSVARDAEHLALLRRVGFRSICIVPLRVAGHLVGALSLAQAESARRLGADDLALAEEVARRASVAIENARLHEAERVARAEAEAANRAKLEFLRAMSHELRTPLNAIGGYGELLALGVRGQLNEAQLADVERIRRSQRHLLGIINDILNFARVDAGYVTYDIGDVPLRAALDATEPLIAPQLREKGIAFADDACDPELVARADGEKVRQILLNLLANAVKFTAPGGRVTVTCAAADDRVSVAVRDTGVGIPPERLHDVFEPFVQVHRSLAAPTTGTGLGLAISRDLARGMGGDLAADSVLGAGSVFTLTLPRATAPG